MKIWEGSVKKKIHPQLSPKPARDVCGFRYIELVVFSSFVDVIMMPSGLCSDIICDRCNTATWVLLKPVCHLVQHWCNTCVKALVFCQMPVGKLGGLNITWYWCCWRRAQLIVSRHLKASVLLCVCVRSPVCVCVCARGDWFRVYFSFSLSGWLQVQQHPQPWLVLHVQLIKPLSQCACMGVWLIYCRAYGGGFTLSWLVSIGKFSVDIRL